MTGTTELSAILIHETINENIASHFTDPQDIQNFSFTNRSTYHFLTTSKVAQNIWSRFTAHHNQKIPPNLYVMLSFSPRVCRHENGSEFDTFGVFEMKFFCPLQDRAVMQCRQIPYIDNPTLHLLGTGSKLTEEESHFRSSFPQFHIPHIKPTREILIRKEILNWLRCLYNNFRSLDARDLNMYNAYIGSSFSFHHFFHEMEGDDTPDLDLTELRSQGLSPNGQNGRNYQTYRQIIDVLLSGDLSFDQFKSLMYPTKRLGTKYMPEQVRPVVFELFQELKDSDKVKNHPLDTLLFLKKVYEIQRPSARLTTELLLRENRLKQVLADIITLPGFSCRTFCAVFLPKELAYQPIERLLDRLELFLEAARDGTLNLFLLNAAFERNPNLNMPLFDMNRAFYEAVHNGLIPLSAIISGKAPLSDFYDPFYLITEEQDARALGLHEPEQLEFTQHINRFYNRFMTLVRDHPDQKIDRHAFIREAIQFLSFMKLLSVDFMRRLSSQSDAIYAYKAFLAFREKTHNLYRDTILKHITHEAHQKIMLSAKVKDFILSHTRWRDMLPKDRHESYETLLALLEKSYHFLLTLGLCVTQFRILSSCSAGELEEAVKQIDLLSHHQDPQELTPALTSLMSLHTHLSGKTIEESYKVFGRFIPLFKQCDFPVQFSIWDLMNATIIDLMKAKDQRSIDLMMRAEIRSITPETWIAHITFMKNEALKLAARSFGTEAGYQICQSFFSSPKRIMDTLLLLASGQWTKDNYIKVVRTFIAMHYDHACMEYYQYEQQAMTYSRNHPTPTPQINVGLPDETDNHVFDPHIFVDAILEATLSNFISDSNTPPRDLWNNACLKADQGKVTH